MKKIVMTLFALLVTLKIMAISIESGSLEELAKTKRANFEVDYSKASIHGMTEKEFSEYEGDWYIDQPQIIAKFIGNLTDITGEKLILTRNGENKLTLRWVILHISTKGNIVSELHVVNSDGDIIAKIVDLTGKGGTFGTKLNLIKDGAKRSGKNAGKFLRKEIQKYTEE